MLAELIGFLVEWTTVVVAGISGFIVFLYKYFWDDTNEEKQRLRKVLERKTLERHAEFERLRSTYGLGPEQKEILNLSWEDLTGKLQKRELKASQVLEAYIAKALEVSERCNPVTDFIATAHARAKELDEMKEVKGPLHGVPFAVKDDTSVQGLDNTHGFVKRLYKPMTESAVLVKVLEDLGAVPFCKTNVPQTLFTYGSDNPVFGTTTNCHNPKLGPGGSSSGSGALVGAGGCMFATGSDIAGSLRIPAHFNGASSIKPTCGRISLKGLDGSLPNITGVEVSLGIIGQNPTVVSSVTKHVIESGLQLKYDTRALPIQWNPQAFESKEKLRIGYCTSMPFFPTMGDSAEVLLNAKQALESLGHTLVPVELQDGYKIMRLCGNLMLADGARHFKKCWKGEEIASGVKLLWIGSKIPMCLQKLVGRIMTSKVIPFLHSKRSGVMFGSGAQKSTDIWDAMGDKQVLIDETTSQWEHLKLDGLICNVMPFPAPLVDSPGMLPAAASYCALWNLVDFPSGVVTMGTESGKNLRVYDDEGDMTLKLAKKSVQESAGAPIGIQVVGRPFKEEVVFRLMKELEPFNTFKSAIKS